ncbi:adenosylcobinamide-GDP ribazoletransferase [Chromobacterium piscinae]|uniref:adenosylcobinamide-GDP ribazoletransferase n=1 Tax=Chromobacterium piscinae TaxID=686831 RepID=UPI0032610A76
MRGLILAVQFLTRLPTPQLADFKPKPEWLAASARWFPAVGAIVGALLLAALRLGSLIDPWLAALLALLAWVMVTGGLHLDGLADLSDALGAAHRSRERFFEVLKDPHLGSFGVLSLILAVAAKLVLLMLAARHGGPAWGLLLVPAWARGFAVAWSATLPAIAPGSGERFAWRRDWAGMGLNLAALLQHQQRNQHLQHGETRRRLHRSISHRHPQYSAIIARIAPGNDKWHPTPTKGWITTMDGAPRGLEQTAARNAKTPPEDWRGCSLKRARRGARSRAARRSALRCPALLLAPLAGLAWWAFLKRRLGGMTGDCLGAGVELCEIAMLGLLLWRVPGWI